jgi:hypothetical protein
MQRNQFISLLLVPSLMIGCHSASKRIIEKFANGNPKVIYELSDRNDTLNYTLNIYYPAGQLHRTRQVTNGKYSGIITTYYASGKIYELDSLTAACDIATGECDGTRSIFYENGILAERFLMKGGRFIGLSLHYDEKGHLAKAYNLIDTVNDGIYKEFYDNGKVMRLATFHMDTLVGNEYIFKENGDTLKCFSHYQGQMDFPYKIWLDDGGTVYGVHLTGEKVLWTSYDKKGNIIKKAIAVPSKSGYVIPH